MAASIKSAKSSSGKGKASSRKAPPVNENRGVWREVIGIFIFGLGLLSLFLVLTKTEHGAALTAKGVLLGLAGCLSYLMPLIICWVGVLIIFSGQQRMTTSPSRIVLLSALLLLVFALVHVFFCGQILSGLSMNNIYNFVAHSYQLGTQAGKGAGAIGAVIAYPLYSALGVWGSCIVLGMLILIDLTLMRKISIRSIGEKARDHFQSGMDEYRLRREQRGQERAARQAELLAMQPDEPEERPARRPKPPRRPPEPAWDAWAGEPAPAEVRRTPRAGQREMYIEEIPQGEEPPQIEEQERPRFEVDVPSYLNAGSRKRTKKRVLEPDAPPPWAQPAPAEPEEEEEAPQAAVEEMEPAFDPYEAPAELPEEEPVTPPVEPQDEEPEPAFEQPAGEEPPVEAGPAFDGPEEMTPVRKRHRAVLGQRVDALEEAGPEPDESGERADEAPPERLDRTRVVMPEKLSKYPVLEPEEEPYNYPPVDLLTLPKPSKAQNAKEGDQVKAQKLEDTLHSFGISAKLTGISHGPAVTRFEMQPAPGIKVSRIVSLSDDIALNLAATTIRIEAPIPGKAAIGVEVPNDVVEMVALREVLESNEARRHPSRLAVALGKDNAGRHIVADLAKMPHVLIAGATGSGKSVCINTIICSILYRATPEEVRLIMIDPKVVELSVYNGIPHLLVPVVTDPKKASGALNWAVVEMTDRYKRFADRGVRDMKSYNQNLKEGEKPLPQIVVIIDELADLMMVTPAEVEESICRLAQLARAAGIHLVIATQRPSVNVITGVIKANIPSRIAFTVASQVDSRTILDVGGAEKLLGRGDMLYAPSGTNKPLRVQGALVTEEEVHQVVEYVKSRHEVEYNEDVLEHMNAADKGEGEKAEASEECDELLSQAVEIVVESGQASISMLQRRLRVGYARAGRLIDEMATRGIVSQSEGAKPRNVLITREQFRQMFGEE